VNFQRINSSGRTWGLRASEGKIAENIRDFMAIFSRDLKIIGIY
jgi:hypothetical protein